MDRPADVRRQRFLTSLSTNCFSRRDTGISMPLHLSLDIPRGSWRSITAYGWPSQRPGRPAFSRALQGSDPRSVRRAHSPASSQNRPMRSRSLIDPGDRTPPADKLCLSFRTAIPIYSSADSLSAAGLVFYRPRGTLPQLCRSGCHADAPSRMSCWRSPADDPLSRAPISPLLAGIPLLPGPLPDSSWERRAWAGHRSCSIFAARMPRRSQLKANIVVAVGDSGTRRYWP